MNTIDQYAVFGHPIKHSKSPRIHQLFAQQTGQQLNYIALDVPAESFSDSINTFLAQGGKGLNCTVPLKELAWQRADNLTERARFSKAVNTLALQNDGSLLGDNTDGIGLVKDLIQNHKIPLSAIRILILGAGGASRGIIGPILEQSPECIWIANRTVSRAQQLAEEFALLGHHIQSCGFNELNGQRFDLILNATSASLTNELPPLPDNLLSENGCCYDLAYANKATTFVQWGQQQNAAKSLDGLGMLVEQAAEAFYIWRSVRPDTKPVISLLNAERSSASNQ
jgi:shikimate dehydrogenase